MKMRARIILATVGFAMLSGGGGSAVHMLTSPPSAGASTGSTGSSPRSRVDVAGGSTPVTGSTARMSTSVPNVALGKRLAAARGWGSDPQWSCLDALWTRESGWRTTVWNYGGSGAYGIPQSLPANKMASFGADYMTNPETQIKWGLWYIAATYGTPCGAWAHEKSHGWY